MDKAQILFELTITLTVLNIRLVAEVKRISDMIQEPAIRKIMKTCFRIKLLSYLINLTSLTRMGDFIRQCLTTL